MKKVFFLIQVCIFASFVMIAQASNDDSAAVQSDLIEVVDAQTVEALPVVEEVAIEEVSVVEETPSVEGLVVVEENPSVELLVIVEENPATTIEVVAVEETPMLLEVVEETPAIEKVVEETPAVEEVVETPAVEEVVETPAVEEVVETPAVEEVVETPAVEEVVETPAIEEVVETPAVEEVVETPVVEEVVEEELTIEEVISETEGDVTVIEEVISSEEVVACDSITKETVDIVETVVVKKTVIIEEVKEVAPEDNQLSVRVDTVIKEVPVEKEVIKEVIKEVPVVKEIPIIQKVEVPVIQEVEVPVIDTVLVEVPVIQEVEVPVIDTVLVEVPIVDTVEVPVIDTVNVPVYDTLQIVQTDTVVIEGEKAPINVVVPINIALPLNINVPVEINNNMPSITEEPEKEDETAPVSPVKSSTKSQYSNSWEFSGGLSKRANLNEPNEIKIQNDLVGQTVTEDIHGYLGGDWSITLAEGDIKAVDILAKSNAGQHIYYDVNAFVQQQGGVVVVSCELQYEVGAYDWQLKSLVSKEINYANTGTYGAYMTIGPVIPSEMCDMAFTLTNHSEAELAVGGEYFDGTEVKKFFQIVPANGIMAVSDTHIQNVKVHFVEIPF